MSKQRLSSSSGYTLIEMSVVIAVLAILAGMYLQYLNGRIDQNNRDLLKKKMDTIEEAIIGFRRKYDRIPCPADATRLIGEENFGVEGATPGACVGGTPAANWGPSGNTVGGVVPTRSLGLSDDYMFDPWGGRFLYAVDRRASAAAAFTTYPVTNTTIGAITVKDQNGTDKTDKAILVILSHGQNQHGAYQYAGTRRSVSSTNTGELKNCHCDDTAAATAFDAIYYQYPYTLDSTAPLNTFDDVTRYYTRQQILSYAETQE